LEYLKEFGPTLSLIEDAYLQDVRNLGSGKSPRDLNYSARSMEALMSRRSRAVATALLAFEQEEAVLGEAFDPHAIQRREFSYILINESAGLLGSWLENSVGDALLTAASALRAAFWLWLEDDDRAMALARTTLEQTARLRAWRLKPDKAAQIEARGEKTTPRDWLEAAGWRRLSILSRSLGEFAHAVPATARWSDAREALAQLQAERETEAPPIQTGRGSALDAVAFAFGHEVMEAARVYQPHVADGLASVLPYAEEDGASSEIEAWLQRCWSLRGFSLSQADFGSGTVQT
jgi:hypothetical protein